jgi:hypothetical protein
VRQPIAASSPDDAFGRQITLRTKSGRGIEGELVGCDVNDVYLLRNVSGPAAYRTVGWDQVNGIRLEGENDEEFLFVAWTVLGAPVALAHGYWSIFTEPVWLAFTVPSTTIAMLPDQLPKRCAKLRAWARFPQGVPEAYRDRFPSTTPRRSWVIHPPQATPARGEADGDGRPPDDVRPGGIDVATTSAPANDAGAGGSGPGASQDEGGGAELGAGGGAELGGDDDVYE